MTERTEDKMEIDPKTLDAVLNGRLSDPFSFFGRHRAGATDVVRTFRVATEGVRRTSRSTFSTLRRGAPRAV